MNKSNREIFKEKIEAMKTSQLIDFIDSEESEIYTEFNDTLWDELEKRSFYQYLSDRITDHIDEQQKFDKNILERLKKLELLVGNVDELRKINTKLDLLKSKGNFPGQ